MRAAVTGGTGFVGVHLIEALIRHGAEVTTLVRSPGKIARLGNADVRIVPGDLEDPSAIRELVTGQDVVFHLAGLVSARSPREFMRVNREGAAAVARATGQSGARLVHLSSMAAAGPAAVGRPLTGEEPTRPVTLYGHSKLAGEQQVRDSGADWIILRPPLVYGPWDTELFKAFRMVRSGWTAVFGDGTQELSAVYGPDLAQAMIAAASHQQTTGRIYYPCHDRSFSSSSLMRSIADAMGRSVRVIRLSRPMARVILGLTGGLASMFRRATLLNPDKIHEFFEPAWTADPSALTRDTGWSADHDLESGLAETLAWYRKRGWI